MKYIKGRDVKYSFVSHRVLLYLFALWLLSGCSLKHEEKKYDAIDEKKSVNEISDISALIEQKIDSVIAGMTLEEMIGQCLMPSIHSNDEPGTIKSFENYVRDYHIGGIVLLKGTLASARHLAEMGEAAPIPLFIAIDAEWGLGMRLEEASIYPKNGKIDKKTEENLMFDYGQEIAKECRDLGINMVLGPVIDVVENKKGVIGNRSFGEDPKLVSQFGVAYSKGLESGGVISVAKHFPGHGGADRDSHKNVAILSKDISSLDSIDLLPFKEYINSDLSGIMAGHIESKALDPEGKAATASMDILTSLLREEMQFKGLILTDAFDMGGAEGLEAADALKAGADIVLCPLDLPASYQNILKSVVSGKLDEKLLKEKCRRILFYKYLFNIIKL